MVTQEEFDAPPTPAVQKAKEASPLFTPDAPPVVKNTPQEAVTAGVESNPVLNDMDAITESGQNPISYLVDNNFLGIREEDATNENIKKINSVFKSLTPSLNSKNPNLTSGAKAWCGALMYEVLTNIDGLPGAEGVVPESADAYSYVRAKEYLNVGTKVTEPKYGDIVVVQNNGQSHVALYAGMENDSLVLLGGNQGYTMGQDSTSGEVNFKKYPAKKKGFKILGYRRLDNMADIKEATMISYKNQYGVIDTEEFQTR
tara:strand:+ start:850 stop:1623 length:774 start_codon:yes stop_codon:yes gene_type:complete